MVTVRRIVTMAGLAGFRTFKSPANLFGLVFLPVLVGLGLAGEFSGTSSVTVPQIVVVNEDKGEMADAFIQGMAQIPYEVIVENRDVARAQIADGILDFAFILPPGFSAVGQGSEPRIEVLHGEGHQHRVHEARALRVIRTLLGGKDTPAPKVIVETPRGIVGHSEFLLLRSVFGMYLLFACMSLLGRAGTLHDERRGGRLQRTLSTGIPMREVATAHVVSLVLIGLVQFALILTISLALGTPWFKTGFAPILVTVVGALFAFVGLAVGLSGITKNSVQAGVIAGMAPLLLAYLGGLFWSADVVSAPLQRLLLANPFHWALEAFREGVAYVGVPGQVIPLAVLVLIGTLGIVIGIQGLRRMEV